jgi:hypothetical protein
VSGAKAYVCISASGVIVGGCVVLDRARTRQVMRCWLRSHPGCRVESVGLERAYRMLRNTPARASSSARPESPRPPGVESTRTNPELIGM